MYQYFLPNVYDMQHLIDFMELTFCCHQDEPVKSTCKTCPEGYYCNATFSPVVNYASTVCPEGFYCPNGTEHAEQYPCPKGTFNNRTGTFSPRGSKRETSNTD